MGQIAYVSFLAYETSVGKLQHFLRKQYVRFAHRFTVQGAAGKLVLLG
jgi:hypothetical protein